MAQAGLVALGIYLLARRAADGAAGAADGVRRRERRVRRPWSSRAAAYASPAASVFFRRRKLRAEVEMHLGGRHAWCARARSPAWGCRDERARRRHRSRRRGAQRRRRRRRSTARCARAAPACGQRGDGRRTASPARSPACPRASTSSPKRLRRRAPARDELEPPLRRARRASRPGRTPGSSVPRRRTTRGLGQRRDPRHRHRRHGHGRRQGGAAGRRARRCAGSAAPASSR